LNQPGNDDNPDQPTTVQFSPRLGRSGRSKEFAAPAEMFLAAGAHYVVPDFACVQDVGGNLMVLADQVCRAVAWVYRNAARFDGDPNRLYIAGQSNGEVELVSAFDRRPRTANR
jgi:arylformamidase